MFKSVALLLVPIKAKPKFLAASTKAISSGLGPP